MSSIVSSLLMLLLIFQSSTILSLSLITFWSHRNGLLMVVESLSLVYFTSAGLAVSIVTLFGSAVGLSMQRTNENEVQRFGATGYYYTGSYEHTLL